VPAAGQLDHRLVRLGAAVAEEGAVREAQPGQLLGQGERGRRRVQMPEPAGVGCQGGEEKIVATMLGTIMAMQPK